MSWQVPKDLFSQVVNGYMSSDVLPEVKALTSLRPHEVEVVKDATFFSSFDVKHVHARVCSTSWRHGMPKVLLRCEVHPLSRGLLEELSSSEQCQNVITECI